MAAVSVILSDNRNRDAQEVELDLSLQSIPYSDINLNRCHKVYENGHYSFAIHLNLKALQEQLNSINPLSFQQTKTSEDRWNDDLGITDNLEQPKESNLYSPIANSAYDNGALEQNGFTNYEIAATARRELDAFDGQDLDQSSMDIFASGIDNAPLSLTNADGSFKRVTGIYLYINEEQKGYFNYYHSEGDYNQLVGNAVLIEQNSTSTYQPFLLHYDATKLQIEIVLDDGQRIYMHSNYFLCTCSSENNRNISRILEELSALNDSQILDLMFMQNIYEESFEQSSDSLLTEHRSYKSLVSYIELIEHIIECYQKQHSIFMNAAKHVLVKGYELQNFESVRSITHKNYQWLMHHPEVLAKIDNAPYGIDINGQKYLPSRMQGEVTKKNYDTPENRAVIGFIRTVMSSADKVLSQYCSILDEQQHFVGNVPENAEESSQAPIMALKGIQIRIFRKHIDTLRSLIASLNRIYLSYAKIFGIRDAVLQKRSLKSKVFREIKPYAAVLSCIRTYLFYGEFNASKDFLLFKVNRLDKLFEYYCLYRIISMLLQNGFVASSDRIPINFKYRKTAKSISSDDQVANTYYFERGKQRITLYYQPIISSNRFENGIRAFRTTLSSSNRLSQYSFFTPDFILKVSSGDNKLWDDDYIIFDSKFSDANNVKRHYIEDLKNKYADEVAIAVLKKRNDIDTSVMENPLYRVPEELSDENKDRQLNNATAAALNEVSTVTDLKPNTIGTVRTSKTDELSELVQKFELVKVKAPCMVFALQGRLFDESQATMSKEEILQNPALAMASQAQDPSLDAYKAEATNKSHVTLFHTSPLARIFRPVTTLGMVEISTRVDSMPELWKNIEHVLPYLKQS